MAVRENGRYEQLSGRVEIGRTRVVGQQRRVVGGNTRDQEQIAWKVCVVKK